MVKWIIVTGGVLSGLGKGVAAASIGNLLANNYKVVPIKCDGYLNVDPGTMNPIEHGEVFVLDDGGEVDMDFGHYERFLNVTCKKNWNLTMGKVYDEIRKRERKGDYLGQTVQLIPHVTNLIKNWWYDVAKTEEADVILLEIGGTVGDIENELYLEAARQLIEENKKDSISVHLTYVPVPKNVNEQKSKPTQQSVSELRSRGINPDLILGRCEEMLDDSIKKKIAVFCGVPVENVISAVDVPTVYEIPLSFAKQGVGKIVSERLDLNLDNDQTEWQNLVNKIKNPSEEVNIAICGKYTKLEDSYASVVESLMHAGAHNDVKVNITWLETTDIVTLDDVKTSLKDIDAVIVPGGFGSRGVEGKIKVVQYCRENNIPFLGICYGLQMAVIDHARNLCNLETANSTEIERTAYPVIDILPDQITVANKGGTMRLGAYPAVMKEDCLITNLYSDYFFNVSERHRHRYEVNPEYHKKLLAGGGLVFSGMSPDGTLVEFIERTDHPYFVATQGHPELKSSLLKPAPLFYGLVKAASDKVL